MSVWAGKALERRKEERGGGEGERASEKRRKREETPIGLGEQRNKERVTKTSEKNQLRRQTEYQLFDCLLRPIKITCC